MQKIRPTGDTGRPEGGGSRPQAIRPRASRKRACAFQVRAVQACKPKQMNDDVDVDDQTLEEGGGWTVPRFDKTRTLDVTHR